VTGTAAPPLTAIEELLAAYDECQRAERELERARDARERASRRLDEAQKNPERFGLNSMGGRPRSYFQKGTGRVFLLRVEGGTGQHAWVKAELVEAVEAER
jgi:hypothetical protein